jgi:AAA15 family ATPase/GTPase
MAIERIEIKDFLVFKGDFSADFCPGVNVFIGGNGTGKTTLMKVLYAGYYSNYAGRGMDESTLDYFDPSIIVTDDYYFHVFPDESNRDKEFFTHGFQFIPEKDILEHSKGLLTFIENKQTGFNGIYRNVLISAMDIPTREQTETQKSVGQKISDIIGGKVIWVQSEGSFYTLKTNGSKIPFANEASGFKKIGYLGLLVASGQLSPGSVLFWDEPENSLNPELMPKLVEILLELSRSGVQIFLATHSYDLARYFDVRKDKSISVAFHNLVKEDEKIICNTAPEYIELENNLMETASAKLFNAVAADAMGVEIDEA